jgi:cytoskeletal protein CcmA (bactofilin family)
MFSKTAEGETVSKPAARTGTGERSVISGDVKITGNIASKGIVEIQGEIDGDIDAQTLIVGAEGRVKGTVRAEVIEVRGKLNGRASCATFTLRSASQVAAEVNYEVLVIESGARIDGRFARAKG